MKIQSNWNSHTLLVGRKWYSHSVPQPLISKLWIIPPLSNKKDGNVDTHNNTDVFQTHYAEWKKSVSEGYILHHLIYVTSMWQNYRDKEEICGCQGFLVLREGLSIKVQHEETWEGWWNCSVFWFWLWLYKNYMY